MTASAITLANAKQEKLFYFVANVAVLRESDGRCLLLRRAATEKVHPGVYAMIGGKLEWNDLDVSRPTRVNGDVLDFENAVEYLLAREAKEEAGIEIDKRLAYINSVAYVRPDGAPTVLVKFAATYKSGKVVPEPGAFDGYVWATADEARRLPCIMGIPEEIDAATRHFVPQRA